MALFAATRSRISAMSVVRVDADGHPDPRPGIDASRVWTPAQLREYPAAAAAFELVRQMPGIADGIRCQCDCKELPDYRSLLTCFEGTGMAVHCEICQAQARLAFRLHKDGRSLAAIRRAIDLRFG